MFEGVYNESMSKKDKFFEYVLPWLILLTVLVLFFIMLDTLVEFLINLSEPVSKLMEDI